MLDVEFFGPEKAQRQFVSVLSQICSFCLFSLFPKLITELKPLDEKLKSEEKLLLTQSQIPEQNGKIFWDDFICAIYVASLSSCRWCSFVFCGMKQWRLASSSWLLEPWAFVIFGGIDWILLWSLKVRQSCRLFKTRESFLHSFSFSLNRFTGRIYAARGPNQGSMFVL